MSTTVYAFVVYRRFVVETLSAATECIYTFVCMWIWFSMETHCLFCLLARVCLFVCLTIFLSFFVSCSFGWFILNFIAENLTYTIIRSNLKNTHTHTNTFVISFLFFESSKACVWCAIAFSILATSISMVDLYIKQSAKIF